MQNLNMGHRKKYGNIADLFFYLGLLLFLIYINDLPSCLHHASPRIFAEDFSLSYAADSPSELESVINSDL